MAPKFSHEEARRLHFEEGLDYGAIAQRFGVRRESIKYACDKERRERKNAHRRDHYQRRGKEMRHGVFIQLSRAERLRQLYLPTAWRAEAWADWGKPDEPT